MRTTTWRGSLLAVVAAFTLFLTGCSGQGGANPTYYKLASVNAVQCTADNAASSEGALRATAGSVAEAMKNPGGKLAQDIIAANKSEKDFTLDALNKALISKADECGKLKPLGSPSPTVSGSASPTPSATSSTTPADTLTQEQIVALTQSASATDYCGKFVKPFTFQGQIYEVLPVNDPDKVEKKYGTSVLHPMKSSDNTGVADEMVEATCLYPYYGGHLASGMSLLKFANADITQLNPVVGPWTLDHSDADRAARAASFDPDLSAVKFDSKGMVADAASAELVKTWLAKRAAWRTEANQILELFFKFQPNGVSARTSVKNFWQLPASVPTVGLAPHQENLPAQEFVLTDKDATCPVVRFGINREDMRFELFEACSAPTQPAPTSPGTTAKPSSPPTHSGCPTGTVWSPEVKKCIASKVVTDHPTTTVNPAQPAPAVTVPDSGPSATAPTVYTPPAPQTAPTTKRSTDPSTLPSVGGTPTTRVSDG